MICLAHIQKIGLRVSCFIVASLLTQSAMAQFGTTPGWGISQVTCQQGTLGSPVPLAVNGDTPEGTFCQDLELAGTFGHVFVATTGVCENGVSLEAMSLEAAWANCVAVLTGEATAAFGTDLLSDPSGCLPQDIIVGQANGNAVVTDFFLGTVVAAGLGGFTDCAGQFSAPIPPALATC